MQVTNGNKTLYHIQNMYISTDGHPIDLFYWLDHFPTEKDLKKIASEEFGRCDDYTVVEGELVNSSEIYPIYADEI